jgi:hypothetical protein
MQWILSFLFFSKYCEYQINFIFLVAYMFTYVCRSLEEWLWEVAGLQQTFNRHSIIQKALRRDMQDMQSETQRSGKIVW